MLIHHIALWTNQLEEMRNFYERYFYGVANEKYINEEKQFESYFLTFPKGGQIELMTKPDLLMADSETSRRIGIAHFSIELNDEIQVVNLTQKLHDEGIEVMKAPRWTGDGYFESVILDPDGNLIELIWKSKK